MTYRLLLPLLTVLATFAGGCSLPSLLIQPVSNSPELQETVVLPGKTDRQKIAVIEVEGMLVNARTGGGLLGAEENKVSRFRQQLERAANDGRVKGIVLRINSPGGTVAASQAMYGDLAKYKEVTGKPVVAACQDVAASGGYYVALAADEIHATPSSVVGSIGVIFNTIDASELMAKLGVSVNAITSGPLKDMGSPFNGLGEEEREVMQGMVDELYGQFTDAVQAQRTVEDPQTAFDGRVFTGTGALDAGLIDRVCDLDASINRARELAGAPGAAAVMYKRPYGYRGSLYAQSPVSEGPAASPVVVDVPGLSDVARMLQPGAYYLWMP